LDKFITFIASDTLNFNRLTIPVMITNMLIVAAGGAIGAVLRYLAGLGTVRIFGSSRIYTGTVVVNITGCFFAGLILGWISYYHSEISGPVLFLTTGILGAYTTFSTFALESLKLIRYSGKKFILYTFLQAIIAVGSVGFGCLIIYWISGAGT
jgi:fluoride exporter